VTISLYTRINKFSHFKIEWNIHGYDFNCVYQVLGLHINIQGMIFAFVHLQ
jgi:hypothetical protein